MKPTTLSQRMRALEPFAGTRVLPETYAVIRVDGRSFSRLTEAHFEKPFDPRFHEVMLKTSQALLSELQGVYAYTESDELSVLLPRDGVLFGGRVEKLVSVAAGLASAVFTHASGVVAHFDARVWQGPTLAAVVDYFRWRQADAQRCALSGCCYWALRRAGLTPRQAGAALDGRGAEAKRRLLAEHGIAWDELPAWQRQGVGIHEATYLKTGYDPQLRRPVAALRRRLRVEPELPVGEDYAVFLRRLLAQEVAA